MTPRPFVILVVVLVHVSFQAHDADWDLFHASEEEGEEEQHTPDPANAQISLASIRPSGHTDEGVAEEKAPPATPASNPDWQFVQIARIHVLHCSVFLLVLAALLFTGKCGDATSFTPKAAKDAEPRGNKLEDADEPCGSIFDDLDDMIVEHFGSSSEMYPHELVPIAFPASEAELEQLLNREGINTSSWEGSVAKLQGELLRGECWLTHEQPIGQPERLVRRVRRVTVRIAALFPTGFRVLKCTRSCDASTGASKATSLNASKKVDLIAIVEDCIPDLIFGDLCLPIDWQRKHLRVVRRTTELLDSSGGEHGLSYLGLFSQYFTEEVWMSIADVNAKGVDGKLKLPSGEGKIEIPELDQNMTRYWEWVQVAEDGWPSCVYAPLVG